MVGIETKWLFFDRYFERRTRTKKRTPEAGATCEGDDYEKRTRDTRQNYLINTDSWGWNEAIKC